VQQTVHLQSKLIYIPTYLQLSLGTNLSVSLAYNWGGSEPHIAQPHPAPDTRAQQSSLAITLSADRTARCCPVSIPTQHSICKSAVSVSPLPTDMHRVRSTINQSDDDLSSHSKLQSLRTHAFTRCTSPGKRWK